jgi:hypothetical protein
MRRKTIALLACTLIYVGLGAEFWYFGSPKAAVVAFSIAVGLFGRFIVCTFGRDSRQNPRD